MQFKIKIFSKRNTKFDKIYTFLKKNSYSSKVNTKKSYIEKIIFDHKQPIDMPFSNLKCQFSIIFL
jgi:hypothetical protein